MGAEACNSRSWPGTTGTRLSVAKWGHRLQGRGHRGDRADRGISLRHQASGCDAKVAGNMPRWAGGLRGIAEAGPTAAANLIEDLGEFDLFDRISQPQRPSPSGVRCDPDDRIARLGSNSMTSHRTDPPPGVGRPTHGTGHRTRLRSRT